jgi:hypothetical protein
MNEIRDDCSGSNSNEIAISHIHIDWTIDFDKNILHGSAVYSIKAVSSPVSHFVCYLL